MHLDGYGASIDYDGQTVTIIGGKVQAKIWGTDRVRIPVADITGLDYKAANPMVNGHLSFKTLHPAVTYADKTGIPALPENGLIVHWRRKDQAAFEAFYRSLPEPSELGDPAARKAEAHAVAQQWADNR